MIDNKPFAMFFNASPRKGWNTHKMLESAKAGAEDSTLPSPGSDTRWGDFTQQLNAAEQGDEAAKAALKELVSANKLPAVDSKGFDNGRRLEK